jgi:hypothetical protein
MQPTNQKRCRRSQLRKDPDPDLNGMRDLLKKMKPLMKKAASVKNV